MFCSECGHKIKSKDKFCDECGSIVKNNLIVEQKTIKINTKKNNYIGMIIFVLILFLLFLYLMINNITKPSYIVKEYIEALNNKSVDEIYNILDIEESVFLEKEDFKQIFDWKVFEDYSIVGTEIVGDEAFVTVEYFDDGNKISTVYKLCLDGNRFWFFSDWNLDFDLDVIIKDFNLTVPVGTVVYMNGNLLDPSSSHIFDIYEIDFILKNEYQLELTYLSNVDVFETIYPTSYKNSYAFNEIGVNDLSDYYKNNIILSFEDVLNKLYDSVVSNVSFGDIENFFSLREDLTIELEYNKLKNNVYNNLEAINFSNMNLYSVDFTDDGLVEISLKADYSYIIDGEIYYKESETQSLIFEFKDEKYLLAEISDVATYFKK